MFTLDLRGLALMRIILGCAILWDLSIIISTLSGILGAESVMPTSIALNNYFEQNYRSLYTISGAMWWQILLISIHFVTALCFLFGRKTKYATPLLRVLTCSIQGANPMVTNGGDSMARLMLLWSIFLPVAEVRSVDAIEQETPKSYEISNIATIGLILQIAHVYFWSYFLKTDAIRRSEYTATYYTLSLDPFVKQAGIWLYQFPKLMKRLTMYTINLELLGPVIYLFTINLTKILVCLGFIGFHAGLATTMYLGAFPFYGIAAWIGLLPTFWRNQGWINSFADHIGTILTPIITTRKKFMQTCSQSINNILQLLPRYEQSFQETPQETKVVSQGFRRYTVLFLCFVIVYSFMRNLRSINFQRRDDYFPTSINRFGFLLRLDQYRAMFAPFPKTDDGRYNITGITEIGDKRINVTHPDNDPFDTKPTHEKIATIVPHEKFRKLIDNLWQKNNSQYRGYFAAYLCRTYNAKATKYTRIKSLNLTYMKEDTLLDYKTKPLEPVDLGTWDCDPKVKESKQKSSPIE